MDYQIGKIQLIENQLPNDFSLNFILDGNRLRSEELSVIFINEESKMHRIAGVRNLDRLLNDVEVLQPNYIVFENLKFSGGDVTEIGLHDSFLLEIDR